MEITKAKIKEIYQKHKQGKSFRELAKEYNTYHYIISAIVKTYETFLDELNENKKLKNEIDNLIDKCNKYIIYFALGGLVIGILIGILIKIFLL